jgi:hypothetical protein
MYTGPRDISGIMVIVSCAPVCLMHGACNPDRRYVMNALVSLRPLSLPQNLETSVLPEINGHPDAEKGNALSAGSAESTDLSLSWRGSVEAGNALVSDTVEDMPAEPAEKKAAGLNDGETNPQLKSASLSMFGSLSALASVSMGVSGPVGEAIGGGIFKGNLHCHTYMSDGNTSPEGVAKWYRDHGYNFLIITDHNKRTTLENPLESTFLLIPGEEVSDTCEGKPLHINGFNISKTIAPQKGTTIGETLQHDIDAINDAGGVAHLNHPFWQWSYDEQQVLQLSGVNLLEIHNDTIECNNFPAGGSRGTEGMWDSLLSQGKEIFGTATDDAHTFLDAYEPGHHWPGGAWVMVQAPDLTTESVLSSLQKGRFYATTGISLSEIAVTESEYSVKIEPQADNKYTTFFIGKEGKVLKQVDGTEAHYEFTNDELYVRAKVISTDGRYAITQPHFLKKLDKGAA